ncbi:MAG: hypothetical protein IT233_01225 [Bacteroidia bacterium]|nr:hypothetical protein [Bacteroidia bacterium]
MIFFRTYMPGKPFFRILLPLAMTALICAVSVQTWISGKFSGMALDAAGNIYTLRDEQLTKWDATGLEMYTYSEKAMGDPLSVDVKGGHRVLLFYPATRRIVVLDNTLTPVGAPLDMKNFGIIDPHAVCLSGESGFWVYDGGRGFIERLSFDGKELVVSPQLSELFGERTVQRMLDRDQWLIIIFKDGSAELFDRFGTPARSVPALPGRRAVEFSAGRMYSLNQTGDSLFWKNIHTLETGEMKLPADSVSSFGISAEKLVLMEPRGVGIYYQK